MQNTRKAFGETLRDLATEGYDFAVVSADTFKSMRVDILKELMPERCFEVGIAEQNMVMVAAGLAATGILTFATSYSVFTSMRTLEQLRTFVAYPNLNVKVIAGLGGFSAGIEGVTHMAMEDLGIVRCIPNMVVINPADAVSTKIAVRAAADYFGPVYLRIGREDSPVIFDDSYDLSIGKANILRTVGNEATVIATGIMVHEALASVNHLEKEGIGVRLIEVHTLKPIDADVLVKAAQETGAIVTVEEHNCIGGLWSAVAEVIVKNCSIPMERVAVEDIYTESALPEELRTQYGLTSENIVKATKKAMQRKKLNRESHGIRTNEAVE